MNFFDFKIAVINERQRELEEESTERIRSAFGRRFIRRDRVKFDQKLNANYFNNECCFP